MPGSATHTLQLLLFPGAFIAAAMAVYLRSFWILAAFCGLFGTETLRVTFRTSPVTISADEASWRRRFGNMLLGAAVLAGAVWWILSSW